jgi:hypothetical protein
VRNLEVRGAKKAEAAPSAIAGQITGDDRRYRWVAVHGRSSFAKGTENIKQYKAILHGRQSAERAGDKASSLNI